MNINLQKGEKKKMQRLELEFDPFGRVGMLQHLENSKT